MSEGGREGEEEIEERKGGRIGEGREGGSVKLIPIPLQYSKTE